MEGMQPATTFDPSAPSGNTAVLDPPAPEEKPVKAKPERKAAKPKANKPDVAPQGIPGACVGLPVQYCYRDGELVPGTLQRQTRTNPLLWDVLISIHGGSSVVRPGVVHSDEPKVGCWNFLPKS